MENEILGNTEFEIFRNYYARNAQLIQSITSIPRANRKNDIISERHRQSVLKDYKDKNYYNCLENYTISLCNATYNGRQYALALANRSAIYFDMKLYQNCINDINLSLQANYPNDKKSKLYFRKIKCLGEMGKRAEMLEAFAACSTFIEHCNDMSNTRKENELKQIKSFVDKVEDVKVGVQLGEISFELDQEILEPNNENASASSAVLFKHQGTGNNTNVEILAARDIKRGEVLFIEKGFVGFHHNILHNDSIGVFYCDLCSKEARNCVPCKTCITVVYCSETCRDTAWHDYHQWECIIFRSVYLDKGFFLPLRFVVKAASDGSINGICNKALADIEYKNQFLQIYRFPVNFDVLRRDHEVTLRRSSCNAVKMVQTLISTKFFDFLMSTPYYSDKSTDDLVNFLGGVLLKTIILTGQRSLLVTRFSPAINLISGFQDIFKLSDMKVKSSGAFCPTVSALQHSCISNTSISFQGNICTVKAFKNIKAGDIIYRSTYHMNPSCPSSDRKKYLNDLGLKCQCESCRNSKNIYENFNTFVCPDCRGRANYAAKKGVVVFENCIDCNTNNGMNNQIQLILTELFTFRWFRGTATTLTLPETLRALNYCRNLLQPYHSSINRLLKHLVTLYSKTADVTTFLEAVKNSKANDEMRYRAAPLKYIFSLGDFCDMCFQFLYNNKGKLQVEEAKEVIIYYTKLIQEAKEVVSVECPYLTNIFIPIDIYLQQFKIDYLQIEQL